MKLLSEWQGSNGVTALMTAAAHGQFEVLSLLVGASANIDTQSSIGETALMMVRNAANPGRLS